MCGFGGGGGGDNGEARAAQARRENAIIDGMNGINNAFRQYDDNFYRGYEARYADMARPDLDRQQRDARQDVLFGLSRSGQTKGSAASKAYGDVADTRARADLQVGSQAREASSAMRNDVENQRASLVAQLNASANAGGVSSDARNAAISVNRPPVYSPISNVFSELTNQFAINEQARRNGNQGWGWGVTSQAVDPIRGSRGSVVNLA